MAQKDQDLDRLKGEVLDYLRAAGLPIYYAFGVPGEEGFAYWDTEQYPDWRQFTDVAREAGSRMFLFSSRQLAAEELLGARETLGEVEMADNDREDASDFLDTLRPNVGRVAWLRIAWQQDGRRFAFERVTPWYEKFLDLLDEIGESLPELSEEEEDDGPGGRGGFYSLN
jgi:hypothetical protein